MADMDHNRDALAALCAEAMRLYGVRVNDNVDLGRLPDAIAQAGVIAAALQERGDARAWWLARRLQEMVAQHGPH